MSFQIGQPLYVARYARFKGHFKETGQRASIKGSSSLYYGIIETIEKTVMHY